LEARKKAASDEQKRRAAAASKARTEAEKKRNIKQQKVKQQVTQVSQRTKTIGNESVEIIEDEIKEQKRTIYRTTVKRGSGEVVYQYVLYNWGGSFYFKNDQSITKAIFDSDIKRYKE